MLTALELKQAYNSSPPCSIGYINVPIPFWEIMTLFLTTKWFPMWWPHNKFTFQFSLSKFGTTIKMRKTIGKNLLQKQRHITKKNNIIFFISSCRLLFTFLFIFCFSGVEKKRYLMIFLLAKWKWDAVWNEWYLKKLIFKKNIYHKICWKFLEKLILN